MAAKKKKKVAKKKSSKKGPNRAALIRAHLERHPDARNIEIIAALQKAGLKVDPKTVSPQISIIKSKLETASKAARARGKKVLKVVKTLKAEADGHLSDAMEARDDHISEADAHDATKQSLASYKDGYREGFAAGFELASKL